MTKLIKKKLGIPNVNPDRLDDSPAIAKVGSTKSEQNAQAFLIGKEQVQPITIRVPVALYKEFRKHAFEQNDKMNQIILRLIKDYMENIDNNTMKP